MTRIEALEVIDNGRLTPVEKALYELLLIYARRISALEAKLHDMEQLSTVGD